MRMTPCGFIGLGSQGAPMARRMLGAGYPVRLWARRAEALRPFADTPAQIAGSVAELGQAEHVGICVLDDAAVREVCAALIPAMRPGSRIAMHSTIDPRLCVELAAQTAARGVALVDAPVSGGAPAAAAGTLTLMAGGEPAALDAALPVFRTFAARIAVLGGVGAGQMAKLVNNAMMAAHVAVADHALAAATRLGIDRAAFAGLVQASSGRSFGFEVYARQASAQAFAHGARLLAKDLGLLGECLGPHEAFAAFHDLATPFLDRAMGASGEQP
jgi:3-hydroxyisobutyrate dehydrogenase-like beta-hydroxyacid dehydrogenase